MARSPVARAAKSAIEFAIALFAARSWPEKKLRERLRTRYDEAETDAAVARMHELGMLDDAAWAERFARERFERGGKGRHRIRAELVARGIESASIEAALGRVLVDATGADVEREKAAAVLASMRARAPRGRVEPDPAAPERGAGDPAENEKKRLFRRMLARGYPADLVRDLLDVS